MLAVGDDGRPLTFQVIASRTMTRLDTDAGQVRTPLSLFCFDLLHVDGRDLLDEPLEERMAVMAAVLPDRNSWCGEAWWTPPRLPMTSSPPRWRTASRASW